MATKLRRSNFHTNADNHVNESINAKLAANLGNISTGNITTTGYIAGPATFTIDPAAVGDNTGTLIVAGNLQVDGTTTTINSTTLEVDDLNITLASGAANATAANGAGITVDGASATITYASASDSWSFNKNVGIGTSSPSDTLEVSNNSNYQLRISSSGENYQIGRNGSDGLLYFYGNQSGYTGYVFSGVNGERMRINSSGNVGIGVSSPDDTLTIGSETLGYGSALSNRTLGVRGGVLGGVGGDSLNLAYFGYESTNSNTAGLNLKAYRTSTGNDWTTTGLKFTFNVDNTDPVYDNLLCFQGGNVGIGTSSPSHSLETVSSTFAYHRLRSTNAAYTGFDVGQHQSGQAVLNLRDNNFMQFLTNDTERMRIDSSGNLLVGRTSVGITGNGHSIRGGDSALFSRDAVGETMQVGRNAVDGDLIRFNSNGVWVGSIGVSGSNNIYISGEAASHSGLTFATNEILPTAQGNITDGAESLGSTSNRFNNLYLSGTANVGNLQTVSSGRIFSGTGGNASSPMIANVSDTNTGIYFPVADTMAFTAGGTEALRINSGGVVNINTTTNTGGKLNVANGSGHWVATWVDAVENGLYFEFRDSGGNQHGSIQASGTGVIYNTTSDIRLKTNIAPITDATNKIMAMNAVTHKWKNDPDADSIHGFIAQEMRDIVPEAVSQGQEENDTWSMDYGRITPIIVAALQDALKEIDMLKNRITELEAK